MLKNQSGETIVEVLIALSVLSLVLGIGYGSTAQSIRVSQDTQERVEASQLAKGMVETIKFLATRPEYENNNRLFPNGPANTNAGQRNICVDINSSDLLDPSSTVRIRPAAPASPVAAPGCYQGPDDRYYVWVDVQRTEGSGTPSSSSSSRYTYTVTVEWEGLSGNQNQLAYRYKWRIVND